MLTAMGWWSIAIKISRTLCPNTAAKPDRKRGIDERLRSKGFVHVDDLRLQLTLDIRHSRPPQPYPYLQKFNAGERDRDGCAGWCHTHYGFASFL